jgi:hypothetical protein
VRAWHFVGAKLRDGRPIPADGVVLRHDGPLVMCESGLHASEHPFDALQYAPGHTLCLVECGGEILRAADKLVCTERTVIVRMDASPLLRHFARQQALSVVHLWEAPQVALDFLMGYDWARTAATLAMAAHMEADQTSASWAARWAAAENTEWAAMFAAKWAAAEDTARDDFAALVNEAFEDWL